PMYLRRTAVIAAVLCTLSGSAGAVVVFDPLNTLEHSFLNGWRASIGAVLTQQLDRVRQLAKRLSADTTLTKYVAPDAPRWRTRRSELNTIAALESDVSDGDQEQSTTAVLDKISAASLIRARQQETRMELLTALTEQLLVDSKRDRDTEAASMNMQLGRLNRGRAVAASLLAGSAADFRSWRQP